MVRIVCQWDEDAKAFRRFIDHGQDVEVNHCHQRKKRMQMQQFPLPDCLMDNQQHQEQFLTVVQISEVSFNRVDQACQSTLIFRIYKFRPENINR
jgi:hypothetical protein